MNWASTFIFIVCVILWFELGRRHVISPVVSIGLLLATIALTIWLLPYFTPVRLKRQPDKQDP
jgi:uncharacterized membrane protein